MLELSFTVPGSRARKFVTATTRMDAVELVFTGAVQRYAEEATLSPSQALQQFCDANPDLWKEYCEHWLENCRARRLQE